MNDTIAVVGTPLVLYFARRHRISPKLLLIALAFAVTTGSVMSPIGNPQNLLIALIGCAPIVAGSRKRWEIVRGIDWSTLVVLRRHVRPDGERVEVGFPAVAPGRPRSPSWTSCASALP